MSRKDLVYDLQNVSFRYDKDLVLDNVSFQIEKGDYVGIVGENGSGKTTLLRLLTGERKPQQGRLSLFGVDELTKENLKKIGYVPQVNPVEQQHFPITCCEMVLLGLCGQFFGPFAGRRQKERALSTLKELDILHLVNRNYRTLSGGQKQRVQIAKALVNDPQLLIFDEPTVGIDESSKERFFSLLDHLNRIHAITILTVTHETELGMAHWKRTLRVAKHHVEEVLCSPMTL